MLYDRNQKDLTCFNSISIFKKVQLIPYYKYREVNSDKVKDRVDGIRYNDKKRKRIMFYVVVFESSTF